LRKRSVAAAFGVALLAGLVCAAPAEPDAAAVRAIVEQVLGAWRDGNARDMAAAYESTGDFVNPTGVHAVGRANVEAYYAAAFAAGYAGSALKVNILRTRHLAPTVTLLDGAFRIDPSPGAKITESASGIFSAVLVKKRGRWWIAAMRESSAQKFSEVDSEDRVASGEVK
jgi:uncharacterized protein (TIGR02246 family)